MSELGFYVVNATRDTFVQWYDTDTLPQVEELPPDFATEDDHLQLVLLAEQVHDQHGLKYHVENIQILAEQLGKPVKKKKTDWVDVIMERDQRQRQELLRARVDEWELRLVPLPPGDE